MNYDHASLSCLCYSILAELIAATWLPATQEGKFYAAQPYVPSVFRPSCRTEPAP
jgi:hypothetical protein